MKRYRDLVKAVECPICHERAKILGSQTFSNNQGIQSRIAILAKCSSCQYEWNPSLKPGKPGIYYEEV